MNKDIEELLLRLWLAKEEVVLHAASDILVDLLTIELIVAKSRPGTRVVVGKWISGCLNVVGIVDEAKEVIA